MTPFQIIADFVTENGWFWVSMGIAVAIIVIYVDRHICRKDTTQ